MEITSVWDTIIIMTKARPSAYGCVRTRAYTIARDATRLAQRVRIRLHVLLRAWRSLAKYFGSIEDQESG